MNLADEALRALVRGAGWRVMSRAPVWACLLILAAALLLGSLGR